MGFWSRKDSTQLDTNTMRKNEEKKNVVYAFLQIFDIFVNVVKSINKNNTDLVFSIVRDFSEDWDHFYLKLSPYLDAFYEKLINSENVKVLATNKKNKCIVRLEFNFVNQKKKDGELNNQKIENQRDNENEIGESSIAKQNTEQTKSESMELNDSVNNSSAMNYFPSADRNQCAFTNDFRIARNCLVSLLLDGERNFVESVIFMDVFNYYMLWVQPAIVSSSCIFAETRDDVNTELMESEDRNTYGEEFASESIISDENEEFEKRNHLQPDGNDSLIPNQYNDLLESLKRPEKVENSTETYKIDDLVQQDVQFIQSNEQFSKDILEKCKLNRATLHETNFRAMHRSQPTNSNVEEPSEQEEEFQRKVNEQNQRHKEELEKKRNERKERRKQNEENINKARNEQKERFALLMKCIVLNLEFQETEQEWSDWIEHFYKRQIVNIINHFYSFQELAKENKWFKNLSKEDINDLKSEITDLYNKVVQLVNDLEDIFNKLGILSQRFHEALFVKVLRKNVCETAKKLLIVLKELERNEISLELWSELKKKTVVITATDVLNVTQLRRICKDANPSDYENIEFPKWEMECSWTVLEIPNNAEQMRKQEDEDLSSESAQTVNKKLFFSEKTTDYPGTEGTCSTRENEKSQRISLEASSSAIDHSGIHNVVNEDIICTLTSSFEKLKVSN